jgi:nuclear pore complex protein Nup160
MYKQGRRFAEGSSSKVTAFDLAAMQARSYLAAINALSLVDKQNAWIALPASSKASRVSCRDYFGGGPLISG